MNNLKRIISLLLALVLTVGLLPLPAYAAEPEAAPEAVQETTVPTVQTEAPPEETELPAEDPSEETEPATEAPTFPQDVPVTEETLPPVETAPPAEAEEEASLAEAGDLGSGTTGNLTWVLGSDGTLSITGTGRMSEYSTGTAPWYSLRAKITSLEIGEGVTYLGNYAFYDCLKLASVTLPATLTRIGSCTFQNCTALTRVEISDLAAWCRIIWSYSSNPLYNGAALYLNGSPVTRLEIPAGITKINDSVFYGCTSLEEVVIPEGVTLIGSSAFYNCKNLTRVSLPDSITTVNADAFSGCSQLNRVDIPSLEAWMGIIFGDYDANPLSNRAALYIAGQQLTKLDLPDSIVDIPNYQFYGCEGLESVTMGDEVLTIGAYAFDSCAELTSVTLPQGLGSIGSYAFSDSGLTSLTIPAGVTKIGSYAFSYCEDLKEVTFLGSAPMTDGWIFYGTAATIRYPAGDSTWDSIPGQNYGGTLTWLRSDGLYGQGTLDTGLSWGVYEDGSLRITGAGPVPDFGSSSDTPWYKHRKVITSLQLGEGVTAVGAYAFREFPSLTAATLPSTLTAIGDYAFYSCTALKSVSLPEGLTAIGDSAFDGCTALKSVTLPEGLTALGTYAFRSCSALESVTFPGSLHVIGNAAFEGCAALTSISFSEGLTSIGWRSFTNCDSLTKVVFPSTLSSLDDYSFANCDALTQIHFTGSSVDIPSSAFSGVTATVYYPAGDPSWEDVIGDSFSGTLTWVNTDGQLGSGTLSTGLTWVANIDGTLTISGIGEIPDFNSSGAPWYSIRSKITNLVVEEGVTKIGQYAFYSARKLKEITLPASLIQIRSDAFDDCDYITQVNLGNLGVWCGSSTLPSECVYDLYLSGTLVEHLVIPQGVEEVQSYAFRGCRSLKSVTIPSTVKSVGYYAFAECTGLESLTMHPSSVTEMPSLDSSAFRDCTALKTVTLPEFARLGDNVFSGCTALEEVTLPSHRYPSGAGYSSPGTALFSGCTALKKAVVLPGNYSVTAKTFQGCTALETVVLPNTLTAIQESAFSGCASLKTISLPQTLDTIGATAFQGTGLTAITIPGAVGSIAAGALAQCSDLKAITFQGSAPSMNSTGLQGVTATVTYNPVLPGWNAVKGSATWGGAAKLTWVTEAGPKIIASGACGEKLTWMLDENGLFTVTGSGYMTDYSNNTPWRDDYADKIKEVRFQGKVQSVGSYAFYGCENLTTVTLPETLEWVGSYAFAGCKNLKNLTLAPADYRDCVFSDCTALVEVTIPAIYNGSQMFRRCTALQSVTFLPGTRNIGYSMFYGCTRLVQVELPDTLETISGEAFYGCTSLKELALPNGVSEISHMAFAGCSDLASVIIPDGVTHLGSCLFLDCTSLTSITIPASVTEVQESAFENCTALKTIKFNGRAPTFLTHIDDRGEDWSSIFRNVTAKAYYPEKYAASWKDARKNYGGTITWIGYSAVESGETEEGMTWELSSDGTLILRGTGDIPDYAARAAAAPWAGFADRITAILLEGSFTRIGVSAFAGLSKVKEVTIPTTVQSIGYGAFAGCEALAVIHYGGSDWQWADIQIEEGNGVLDSATRIEPAHKHRPVNTVIPGWPATDTEPGREDVRIKVCEGCGVYVHEDATEISQEELEAIFLEHTLYRKATSLTILENGQIASDRVVDLNEGEALTLTAKLLPASAKPGITWSASPKSVATVNAQGRVVFLEPGTVTITAKGPDGVRDSVKLTATWMPRKLTLSAPEDELRSGKSMTLSVKLSPENTTDKALLWSISDPTLASISRKGVLKAKTVYEETPVTVTVSSKADPSLTDSVTITLLPKTDTALAIRVDGLSSTAKTIPCDISDSFLLAAYASGAPETVTWKPSKAGAAVDAEGNLTFTKAGTYSVTAKTADGRTAKVTFKVTVLAKELHIQSKTGHFGAATGKKLGLTARILPENAKSKSVTWEILEGKEFAKLSSSGSLSAAKGLTEVQTVLVRATTKDGSNISATQEITIYPAAAKVLLDQGAQDTLDMSRQEYYDLTAKAEPAASFQAFTWSSSKPKVAQVDETGRVTPLKPGTVTITAKAADGSGKYARFKLTVTASVTSLTLPETAAIAGGKTLTLKPEIGPTFASSKKLTWSCDADPSAATITAKGQLKTKKVTAPVTCTVTAKTTDGSGWEAACDVTIYPAATGMTMLLNDVPAAVKTVTVKAGTDVNLGVQVLPDNAFQEALWTSSKPKVAQVDEYGTVTTLAPGTATITAKSADGSGKKVTIKIAVE